MFKHAGKLYETTQAGSWIGSREITVPEHTPNNHWAGPKIPLDLWQQILSFLEWSQVETKSETMVHLFANETSWQAIVLPQAGFNGMTVNLLPDHANRIPSFERSLVGSGWQEMGTVHHHCNAAAFQSGTDSTDERTKEGLHITIGNLGAQTYSVHARTSFRQTMFDAVLSEWFELDPAMERLLPPHILSEAVKYHLTKPVRGAFPEWWKENVIRVERTVYRPTGPVGLTQPWERWKSEEHSEIYRPANGTPVSSAPTPAPRPVTRGRSVHALAQQILWFKQSVLAVCEKYNVDVHQVWDALDGDLLFDDLVSAMLDQEFDLVRARGIIEEMCDEELVRQEATEATDRIGQLALTLTAEQEEEAHEKAMEEYLGIHE